MKSMRLFGLSATLVLLLGGCYAVQGDGYTHYTPFKILADAEANKIKAAKKRKAAMKQRLAEAKKKRLAKKAAPAKVVVKVVPAKTTVVVVDERTRRQLRINELTQHVASLRNKSRKMMESTLTEMISLNAQAQEATKELIVLYQAEAKAAIGLVGRFRDKAAQLPPGDAQAFLQKVEQRRRDEAEALLMLADNEQLNLERLEHEHGQLN